MTNSTDSTNDNQAVQADAGKSQPWKRIWPPQQEVRPIGNQVKNGKVILFEGGGAYPNKIKDSEGRRL